MIQLNSLSRWIVSDRPNVAYSHKRQLSEANLTFRRQAKLLPLTLNSSARTTEWLPLAQGEAQCLLDQTSQCPGAGGMLK
jgi:hypothetical protein